MTAATRSKSKPTNKTKAVGPTPEEKLTQRLISLLEKGVNPWRREWRGSRGGPHRNLITGKAYRGSNPVLLEMELALREGGVPLWLGFGQAKQRGWFPIKGSQAAYVLRPNPIRIEETDGDGKPVLNEQGEQVVRAWTAFKPVAIFNASDLQGDGLAEAISKALGEVSDHPAPERIAAADAVLTGWAVPVTHGGDMAFYSPTKDRIQLPELKAFVNAEGYYATWAHEQVHSTGHSSRLDRDLGGARGSERYAREELVAELGAFLVCSRLEIASNTENHAAYLDSWLGVLKQSPKALLRVLGDATKAANLLAPETYEDPEA
jgi:antirestriction protein ArdC